MATLAELIVKLGLNDEMSGDLKKSKKSLAAWGKSVTKAGGLLTVGLTAPIMAIGGVALKAAGDYDNALDMIRVATGATGDELNALGEMTREIFRAIPTDMDIAATAISELAVRTDATGDSLKALAIAEIELARITGTDLSTNIKNTTQMFAKWGISVDDMVPSLDMLFRASQATGIGVDELSQLVTDNAAVLAGLGFDFAGSLAILGQFELAGVKTGTAMTGLKNALAYFIANDIDPATGFRDLIEAIKNAPTDIIGTQLAIEVFGKKAGPELAAAIRSGKFDTQALLDIIKAGGPGIVETAKATNDYAEKLKIARNNAQDALVPIGILLFDAITKLSPKVIELSEAFAKMTAAYGNLSPAQKTVVIDFIIMVAILGPLLILLGQLVAIAPAVALAFTLMTGPIGLLIIELGLLFLAYQTNFMGFAERINIALPRLGLLFLGLQTTILIFTTTTTIAIKRWADVTAAAMTVLSIDGSSAMDHLKTNVLLSVGSMAAGALAWLDVMEIYFQNAFDAMKTDTGTRVGEMYANVILLIQTLATDVYNEASAVGSAIGLGIQEGIDSIWVGTVAKAAALVAAVIDVLKNIPGFSPIDHVGEYYGAQLGEGFGRGISNAEFAVNQAASGMVGAAVSGISGPVINGGMTISVSGAGDPNAVADRVFAKFAREMGLAGGV